jgi:hypothetical protein
MAARQRSGDVCWMRAPTVLVTALVYRPPQLVSALAHTSPTKCVRSSSRATGEHAKGTRHDHALEP